MWIPVEDRLPEDEKSKVVWVPANLCAYMATYVDGRWRPWQSTEKWRWWIQEITHWMPLPEPPK